MDSYRRSTLAAILVILVLLFYFATCVTFTRHETVKQYPLVKNADGTYVTHHGLGYYCTYSTSDGGETVEFISNDKVRKSDEPIASGSVPKIEYIYIEGVYYLKYPGGALEIDVKPYFDSVRFLVPEGAIAER